MKIFFLWFSIFTLSLTNLSSAYAALVTISVSGTLSQSSQASNSLVPIEALNFSGLSASVSGVDGLNFDGATLSTVYTFNTDTPANTGQYASPIRYAVSDYVANVSMTITNRPNDARDAQQDDTLFLANRRITRATNVVFLPHSPRDLNDFFSLKTNIKIPDIPPVGAVEILVLPNINFDLGSYDFFPEEDIPSILFLENMRGDITNLLNPAFNEQFISAFNDDTGDIYQYRLVNATATITTIPIPAAAWFFASAVGGLAGMRRFGIN